MKYQILVGDDVHEVNSDEDKIMEICMKLHSMGKDFESLECWDLADQVKAHIEYLKKRYLGAI